MEKKFYHTQESRDHRLANPIPCTRDDAWLGNAMYFWYEEVDGIMFQDLPSNSKRLLVKPVKKGRTVFA